MSFRSKGVFFCLAGLAVLVPYKGFSTEPSVYTQRPRVLAINFNPIIPSHSNQRLHVVCGWSNPNTLNDSYIVDMDSSSHGLVKYRLTKSLNADFFPVKYDGFRYTNADENTEGSYLYAQRTGTWHSPDGIDYKTVARDYDLCRRCDRGEVDEVFMHGGPYFGYYESRMIGKGAYWCNSSGLTKVAGAKKFVLMGFNYERGVDCMLEDYGHRTESIMWQTYGSWSSDPTHAWNRFTLYDMNVPGEAACGNVHYAPNSTADYQWGNTDFVWSSCDDWLIKYPNLLGTKKLVNCTEWGNGDQRLHHIWWFQHMPHVGGTLTEYSMTRLNNWWDYTQDLNAWSESGGEMIGSTMSFPAGPPVVRLTTNDREDFSPRINSSGRIVWSGYDGADFEIYSSNADGSGLIQISNLSGVDEDPRINSSGRIVWTNFFNGEYDIYCANSDGTGVVQVTNNLVYDFQPEINDNGRIVWTRFDGKDLEIYSANSDGTNIVQITNNEAASGMPTDDCWAHINNSGRIIWMGFDGNDWEIYSANSDGTGLTQISDNSYDDEYPRINNSGQVVWHTFRSTTNAEIYSANQDGSSLVRLTNNSYQDWYPQINNWGKIAWMSFDGADWEIYQSNSDGTGMVNITNNSAQDMHPVIDDNGRIVWQSIEKNAAPNNQNYQDDWEICAYYDGSIKRITNNTFNDRAPAVAANGGIAWHGDSGIQGQADIYCTNDFDTDGDTLPDAWEMTWFGNLSHNAAGDDDVPQGDGATNYEEYVAGTDPTNPLSFFAITNMWQGSVTVEWSSVTGKMYSVYYSASEYGSTMTWTLAQSNIAASGTDYNTWTDTSSLDGITKRFYKVVVQQ
jgi:Tol biopolymer transport system component